MLNYTAANVRYQGLRQISIAKKDPLEANEYIYIISDELHKEQNIFKIGRTTNPNNRRSQYNTRSASEKDEFNYLALYKVVSAKAIEQLIFTYLTNFNIKKEMFRIPLKDLMIIIETIIDGDSKTTSMINTYIETGKMIQQLEDNRNQKIQSLGETIALKLKTKICQQNYNN
jgi:hypothetical protein